MLKLYLNELKKLKRKQIIWIICLIAIIMPLVWTLICIRDSLRYRSLVGLTIMIGNFLIAPFLFTLIFLLLFQVEEQNNALKNILVTSISKWKIYAIKAFTSVTVVIAYNCITMLYTTISGGLFLNNFSYLFIGRTLLAYMSTAVAVIAASTPVMLVIVLFRRRYMLSMILVNCFTIINFLFVWQCSMLNNLKMHLPILVAYRITYPMQVVEYGNFTAEMMEALKMLSYPKELGIGILLGTAILFGGLSMLVYQYQEE